MFLDLHFGNEEGDDDDARRGGVSGGARGGIRRSARGFAVMASVALAIGLAGVVVARAIDARLARQDGARGDGGDGEL